MLKVRELKGWAHVFTLADGSSFRIYPHEEKLIEDKNVSDDLKAGVSMRLISINSNNVSGSSTVNNYSDKSSGKKK